MVSFDLSSEVFFTTHLPLDIQSTNTNRDDAYLVSFEINGEVFNTTHLPLDMQDSYCGFLTKMDIKYGLQNLPIIWQYYLMNEGKDGWNLQLVYDLFLPFEAQQIAQIPISSNHREKFVWWKNKKGKYTVKSAYHFLKQKIVVQQSNQSLLPQHSKVWSKLWKIRTVPRHAHLIWRLLHYRLPVKMALFNKGINCSPQCCFCDSLETIEHLFMECERAQSVWFVSPLGVNFSSTTAPAKSV